MTMKTNSHGIAIELNDFFRAADRAAFARLTGRISKSALRSSFCHDTAASEENVEAGAAEAPAVRAETQMNSRQF
jgi:hypothetical protein